MSKKPNPDYRFFDRNDDFQEVELGCGVTAYTWETPEAAMFALRGVDINKLENLPWTLQKCQVQAVIHLIPARLRVNPK